MRRKLKFMETFYANSEEQAWEEFIKSPYDDTCEYIVIYVARGNYRIFKII